jgi:SAM-dependent methyltransferase
MGPRRHDDVCQRRAPPLADSPVAENTSLTTMPDWDGKYAAAPIGLFGREPNEYVREITARSDFAARSALCLADGDGRNSRWLALRGIETTAVDISAVATRNALAMDRTAGVAVQRIVADLETWRPSSREWWDAVFLIYLQATAGLRTCALRLGWKALRPGGWLVLEAFAKSQARGDVGPDSPDLLYDLDEIAAALPGHGIVEAVSGRVRLDEGSRHRGEVEVVRFTACKP